MSDLQAAIGWDKYDSSLREKNRFVVRDENYFRCLINDAPRAAEL